MGKKIKNKVVENAETEVDTAPTKKNKKATLVSFPGKVKDDKPSKIAKNETVTAPNDTPVVQEKALKRKKKDEKKAPTVDENEDEIVPVKKVKNDSTTITVGTTIDQVPGIKQRKKKTKREKHAKNVDERRKKSKNKASAEVLEYLKLWKNSRDKWRFEKIKQIYIQTHIFDENIINAEVFTIALEYLSGTRGSSKESLTKTAETIIKEIDASCTKNADDTAQESVKYQRARELLQSLG